VRNGTYYVNTVLLHDGSHSSRALSQHLACTLLTDGAALCALQVLHDFVGVSTEPTLSRRPQCMAGVGRGAGLPHSNSNNNEYKVERMCCESYCALQTAHFHHANALLYATMDDDYARQLAHSSEPHFGRFEVLAHGSYSARIRFHCIQGHSSH
jgi:hypothetical protein